MLMFASQLIQQNCYTCGIAASICSKVNTFCGTVAAKVAIDGLIFGPIDLLIFFT
ncbi:hypothetical protein YC2023_040353 [Brassica napus]